MQATNRTEGYWPNANWDDCQERVTTAVSDYPMATALATFGIGLAIGAAVGVLIGDAGMSSPRRPETLSQKTFDAMSQVLPESLMRRIRS